MLKLEHDARQLQQEADKGNMIPIWRYQRAIRGRKKQDRNYVLNKADGTKTKTPLERQQRWAEWIGKQFSISQEQEIPRNMYIPEQTWKNIYHGITRQGITRIPDELTEIRMNSKLQTLMQERPEVEQRIAQPCAAEETKNVLAGLKNSKSMGTDGIPGEVYKV